MKKKYRLISFGGHPPFDNGKILFEGGDRGIFGLGDEFMAEEPKYEKGCITHRGWTFSDDMFEEVKENHTSLTNLETVKEAIMEKIEKIESKQPVSGMTNMQCAYAIVSLPLFYITVITCGVVACTYIIAVSHHRVYEVESKKIPVQLEKK